MPPVPKPARMLLIALPLVFAGVLGAQPLRDAGQLTAGLEPQDRLGQLLPLNLSFQDHHGKLAPLSRFFAQGKPVIVVPVYFRCPGFCSTLLNGTVRAINQEELRLGGDYQVLAFSFNSAEPWELGREKARAYHGLLRDPLGAEGFHFLRGEEAQVRALLDALGFQVRQMGEDYAHAAMLAVISPQGKITRTLAGVEFAKRDFHLALLEAAQGKVGTVMDRFMLYCFRFNQESGAYSFAALRILRLGGGLTLLTLLLIGAGLWKKEFERSRRSYHAR